MTQHPTTLKKGFTIIEVVLVLAIGGLILMMAIVVFPRLQAASNDTQRKEDIDLLQTQLVQYQSNNRGALPNTTGYEVTQESIVSNTNKWDKFYNNYLLADNGTFADPDGTPYNLNVVPCGDAGKGEACDTGSKFGNDINFEDQEHYITIVINAYCGEPDADNDTTALKSTGNRNFALLYRLESNDVYCVSN